MQKCKYQEKENPKYRDSVKHKRRESVKAEVWGQCKTQAWEECTTPVLTHTRHSPWNTVPCPLLALHWWVFRAWSPQGKFLSNRKQICNKVSKQQKQWFKKILHFFLITACTLSFKVSSLSKSWHCCHSFSVSCCNQQHHKLNQMQVIALQIITDYLSPKW